MKLQRSLDWFRDLIVSIFVDGEGSSPCRPFSRHLLFTNTLERLDHSDIFTDRVRFFCFYFLVDFIEVEVELFIVVEDC
jgi:hypothetical protein